MIHFRQNILIKFIWENKKIWIKIRTESKGLKYLYFYKRDFDSSQSQLIPNPDSESELNLRIKNPLLSITVVILIHPKRLNVLIQFTPKIAKSFHKA